MKNCSCIIMKCMDQHEIYCVLFCGAHYIFLWSIEIGVLIFQLCWVEKKSQAWLAGFSFFGYGDWYHCVDPIFPTADTTAQTLMTWWLNRWTILFYSVCTCVLENRICVLHHIYIYGIPSYCLQCVKPNTVYFFEAVH